jgi:hypothetical protein
VCIISWNTCSRPGGVYINVPNSRGILPIKYLGNRKNRFINKNKLEYKISCFKKIVEYTANHPVALIGLTDRLKSFRRREKEGEKEQKLTKFHNAVEKHAMCQIHMHFVYIIDSR